jgi:ribosome-associated translation inhibitor RaiA
MLLELAKETEVLNIEDSIGSAVSKMQDKKALPVFDKNYVGMLYLRDLVTKTYDINTKISGLVKKARKLENGLSQKELIEAFLEYPVLPAFRGEKFAGTISDIDFIESLGLKGKACEYSREAEIISPEYTIGAARNLLRTNRVVLVAENGRIIGGIDIFSLSKHLIPKKGIDVSSHTRGGVSVFKAQAAEKIVEKDIKIRPVMAKAAEIELDSDIKDAISRLRSATFLVCGDFALTPVTILRTLRELESKEVAGSLKMVGFDYVDRFENDLVIKEIERFAKRAEKLISPQEIKFHLKVSQKLGKDLYSIDAKVIASGQVLTANLESREFLDLAQEIIDKLDSQISKLKR